MARPLVDDHPMTVAMDEKTRLALFEQIIVPHLNAAYNLAAWLTRNKDDAEDVVQEAYLRAFRFFGGFHGGDGKAWLLAIVRNTCQTWLRREKGTRSVVMFDEQTHSPEFAKTNPEVTLLKKFDVVSLRECLEGLPVDYREVVILRELEEMSYQEIADVVKIPIGTVMSRLSRARQRLAECVAAKVNGDLV
jgi:RNA polymerase sigma factor (sigma-70 family)